MNILLSGFTDWLGKNWIILVLIVFAIALLVPTYIRQKKEVNARNELNSTIKKGTKIITTAGVYGVVESIRETTDGKVVTIVTGNAKNPTTMDIHINAIGGIDNKTPVTISESETTKPAEVKNDEKTMAETVEEKEEVAVEVKKAPKKATTKKQPAKKAQKQTSKK